MRLGSLTALLVACSGGDDTATPCSLPPLTTPESGFFTDISDSSGMRVDNFYEDPPTGTQINDHSRLAVADINGDGFDDLVMHSLFPNAQNGVPFEHLIFLNQGDGTFTDFSDDSGLRDVQAGFFAFGDVDNDGDLDLTTRGRLYQNNSPQQNFLKLKLTGSRELGTNAVGAVARLTIGNQTLTRQITTSTGQGNANSQVLHFGLGTHDSNVNIEIAWPGNFKQTMEVSPNKLHVIRQPSPTP